MVDERDEGPSQPDEIEDGVQLEPADATDPMYLQPPAGIDVRRPETADIPAIAELYRRAARPSEEGSTGRGALRTEGDLRRTWEQRRNDALIAERDGDVVGYLEFHEAYDPWTPELDLYAEGRVAPDARGHGVGSFLLARAHDRARRAALRLPDVPTVLRTTVVDPVTATVAWHERRGFHVQRHLLQLRIDLSPDLPMPAWPDGVTGAAADTVALADVHRALTDAFADHHLGATDDLDTWRAVVVDRGRVDLSASCVALGEHGTVVGVALGRLAGEDDPGLGVITDLGVLPGSRGSGLATALLRATFRRFAELGADRVGLEVDDVTLDGAFRLYERAGMEVVHHTIVLATDPL